MLITKRLVIGATTALLFLGTSTYVSSAFDSTAPTIDSCSITPNKLGDAGGQITTSVHVTSSNGLSSDPVGPVYLESNTSRQLGGLVMTLTDGDRKSGTYKQTFTVPANLMPGRYYLTIFPLTDVSQNSTNAFYKCATGYIDYGTVATPTPTPSTSLKPTPSATATTSSVLNQSDQATIDSLKAQVASLSTYKALVDSYKKRNEQIQAKLDKVCSPKPKPKGC